MLIVTEIISNQPSSMTWTGIFGVLFFVSFSAILLLSYLACHSLYIFFTGVIKCGS